MQPAIGMTLLWLLFIGTHVGLGTAAVRRRAVARLGEWTFTLLFSLVAAVLFTWAVWFYADHRAEGWAGLALGGSPLVRGGLMMAIVLGIVLATASFESYSRSPYSLFSGRSGAPRGIERITRHPFFAGVVLVFGAHALLAGRLIGTIFALGFVCLAVFGAWHQDRKYLARKGEAYAAYLRVTSTVPFGAILAGRQQFVWRELPARALAGGVAVAVALRAVHDSILTTHGMWFSAAVVGGAALITLETWLRVRRQAAKSPGSVAAEPQTGDQPLRADGVSHG